MNRRHGLFNKEWWTAGRRIVGIAAGIITLSGALAVIWKVGSYGCEKVEYQIDARIERISTRICEEKVNPIWEEAVTTRYMLEQIVPANLQDSAINKMRRNEALLSRGEIR